MLQFSYQSLDISLRYNLNMKKITVKDLKINIDDKKILKGINVEFETGKNYAIIGANGNGKSTLFSSIMGDPNLEVISGTISIDGKVMNEMSVDERAREGIFLGMQYPSEINGVSNVNFLNAAKQALKGERESVIKTYASMKKNADKLNIDKELIDRDVNVGFSGGEKKKNELLQMTVLDMPFNFLDEIDSGVDVDTLKVIGKTINELSSSRKSFIIISHYKELYEMVKPDVVIVIKDGNVDQVGGYELIEETFKKGFNA